ncbi:MAG: hypothetical protein IPM94_16115 [bacterium]|nr:hypothetical protein [bacterium]
MRKLALLSWIMIASALGGCLPPYASVVVRDATDLNSQFVRHDGDFFSLEETYSLHALSERLANPAISHVKIYRTGASAFDCKTAVLDGIDGNQLTLCLDASSSIPLSEIDRIDLFREIPETDRHQGFLVSIISVTLLSVAGQGAGPGPWD